MIRKTLYRLIGIFNPDGFVGKHKYLNITKTKSKKELEKIQFEKLKHLITHHFFINNWYKEMCSGFNIDNFKNIDDIKQLPILEKHNLKNNFGNVNANLQRERIDYKIVRSGGTTGDPVQIHISSQSRSMALAEFYRYYEDWGISKGDSVFLLWGQHPAFEDIAKTKGLIPKFKNWMLNYKIANSFYIDDEKLKTIYNEAMNFNSKVLRGYTNSLHLFCLYMKKNNLPVWSNLKMISSTSENLTSDVKNMLEEYFSVPVSNQYGAGEVNSIAADCSKSKKMHIESEHVYLEVVDENGNQIFDKPGRILITDLDNYATPLIRYSIGDLGVISSELCNCGRAHPVLQEITGRLSEVIELANGRKVNFSYFAHVLREVLEIEKACVRVLDINFLEIDLVLNSNNLQSEVLCYIQKSVREHVGVDILIKWRQVDHIPKLKNGKSPWVRYIGQEYTKPIVIKTFENQY